MGMGTCRSCFRRVVWAKKADGRDHPLDQVPPSEGNIRIVDGVIHIGKKGTGPYQSHFATCAQAGQWRDGKRPNGGGGKAA